MIWVCRRGDADDLALDGAQMSEASIQFRQTRLSDSQHDDGFVVEAIFGALEMRDVGEDCLGDV
jgi:hypothetical protein